MLAPHDRRVKERFGTFGGEVVSGEGDSYFVVFRDARQAVQCAVAIQDSLASNQIHITGLSELLPRRVRVRIGVHTGTAAQIARGGRPNYNDHTINIAHRIQEHAVPDQILTSRETWNDAGEIEGICDERATRLAAFNEIVERVESRATASRRPGIRPNRAATRPR